MLTVYVNKAHVLGLSPTDITSKSLTKLYRLASHLGKIACLY